MANFLTSASCARYEQAPVSDIQLGPHPQEVWHWRSRLEQLTYSAVVQRNIVKWMLQTMVGRAIAYAEHPV
jgi:hypothetical protein